MMKIKVIKQEGEYFKAQVEKYEHLVDPISDHSLIKRREKYIRYLPKDKCWIVFLMPASTSADPILRGRFDNLVSAVHCALA